MTGDNSVTTVLFFWLLLAKRESNFILGVVGRQIGLGCVWHQLAICTRPCSTENGDTMLPHVERMCHYKMYQLYLQ